MTNIEFADSLRQVADFYAEHPDMPQVHNTFFIFTYERNDFLKAALELAKGGKVEKKADPIHTTMADYHAMRTFGSIGGITIDVRIPRGTLCKLVTPAVYECPDSLLEEAAEYTEAAL